MNGRKGRNARRLSRYRAKLRQDACKADGTGTAGQRSLYWGSKAYKTAGERRPHKGGRVHS